MTALLYIFPALFLIMGIGAFFIDLDSPKGKFVFIGMAFVLIVMLAGNEISVFMHVKEKNELQVQTQEMNDWKTGQIARMNTLIASTSNTVESEKQKIAFLARLGWSSNNPFIQEAYAADEARKELLEFIPKANYPAIVENLPQNVDKMLVSFALEEMGFTVRAVQTQEQYIESAEEDASDAGTADEDEQTTEDGEDATDTSVASKPKAKPEVNTLFFGHLVRNNDIKLVLYTMLRAGIQIKQVKVFRNQTNENARSIQFSYSKTYDRRIPFDVDKIKSTKLFKR